ncbi:hypothetical protein ABMA57_14675 [Saccharospirillum sp. HFRX-1]|uniref:hypothetical protein n=1 Tax=unclassified Saccharospirillum TaxID=2633430 RepID=UPI0037105961
MNYRCCGKISRPKVHFKANPADVFGIAIVGGFFLVVLLLIAWGLTAALWSSMLSGEFGEHRRVYGIFILRSGSGLITGLMALVIVIPIFLRVLTFFVDYKLIIETHCRLCGSRKIVVDLPDKEDPF